MYEIHVIHAPLKLYINIKTCLLLRLAGVYGPGEKMIVKRSLAYLESKIASSFVCYNKNLQTDFVHIRNVVQATVKVNFISRHSCNNQYRVLMWGLSSRFICMVNILGHEKTFDNRLSNFWRDLLHHRWSSNKYGVYLQATEKISKGQKKWQK